MLELGNLRHFATGRRVYICIAEGLIAKISYEPTTPSWVDCNGNIAMPGLIDMHVHGREDQPSKETPRTLERSATLGGVTTLAKMPNTKVPATRAEIITVRADQDKQLRITTKFWLGATLDNISEIIEVAKHLRDIVIGVKIYMGSSTGNLLVTDPEILRNIFQTCAEYGLMVGVHAEDEALMKRNLERYGPNGENAKILDHCVIRSTEVEVSAVRLALILQKQTSCKLYFCHISTPEALEIIKNAKDEGRTVYAEVCPHHLYLHEGWLGRENSGRYKMNPSLRTYAQIQRLIKYVCTPGWVDTIATDHAPHDYPNEKVGQTYLKTASGVPGLQTMLPAMFNFVHWGKMDIRHFVNLTSTNAAKIFGLRGKGKLEAGYDADITVINPSEVRILRDQDMATLWPWTPFDGMIAWGFPTHVIARGQSVFP